MLHEQKLPSVPQIRPAFATQDDVYSQCRCLSDVGILSNPLTGQRDWEMSLTMPFMVPPSDRNRPR